MKAQPLASHRITTIKKSAIHEMTRLSKGIDDVAFLSWAKPTSPAPSHIGAAAIEAIQRGATDGYSESMGLAPCAKKL